MLGLRARDGRETRHEGAGALVPSDNWRLSGCKRAEHDHLLERRARLLRHDSSLSAGPHVSSRRACNHRRNAIDRRRDVAIADGDTETVLFILYRMTRCALSFFFCPSLSPSGSIWTQSRFHISLARDSLKVQFSPRTRFLARLQIALVKPIVS